MNAVPEMLTEGDLYSRYAAHSVQVKHRICSFERIEKEVNCANCADFNR